MGFSFFSLHFGEDHTVISDGRLRDKYLFIYVLCTIVLLRTSSTTQHPKRFKKSNEGYLKTTCYFLYNRKPTAAGNDLTCFTFSNLQNVSG